MEIRKPNILIVDDDPVFRFTATRMLRATNAAGDVHASNNGPEALEYLQSVNLSRSLPDVIFLDINMPGMNGWEFLEEYEKLYRQHLHHTNIYIISSSMDRNDLRRAKENKCVTDYLVKPIAKEVYSKVLQTIRA